jgi:hypothetical protein
MELVDLVGIDKAFPSLHCSGTDVFGYSNPPIVRDFQDLGFTFQSISTGTSATINAIKSSGSGGFYFDVIEHEVENKGELTPRYILNQLTQTFNLTQEDLSNICGSARKSINNWLNGDLPNKTKNKRLLELYLIKKEWVGSGFSSSRNLLDLKVLGEMSVLELLSQDDLDKEKILFAGSRLTLGRPDSSAGLRDPFA